MVEVLPTKVVVHPLVLLSVVDHFFRVARNTNKRVVGVLLGQVNGDTVNVANSYALPFEEDEKDSSVWFLDHNYHEAMYDMCKKVNGLHNRLADIHAYLGKVAAGTLPVNHAILYNLQDMFNLLPNLEKKETVAGFAVSTNDELLVNKITNREEEKKQDGSGALVETGSVPVVGADGSGADKKSVVEAKK
ncbi:hypothetical protein CcCBS67573_g01848 [Chytriomyces confervae]|uniref:MPN domain-containing protein n=1 Tax=Chytriomyces confervae TaxID=246404 RepID=A0A507FMD0_9FUNG|nr:hypothetical protein CcCBS67573_g01848 [Chytriomyces confervae]